MIPNILFLHWTLYSILTLKNLRLKFDHPEIPFYPMNSFFIQTYTKVLVNKIENGYDKHKVHA